MAVPAGAGTAAPAQRQLEDLRAAAVEAAERCGGWDERTIVVAGFAVRLRFAGEPLTRALYPSFSHLEGPAGEPAGTIEVFESAESGIERPALPWGEIPGAEGEPIVRLEEGAFQGVADSRSTVVAMADLPRRIAVMHLPDIAAVPGADLGARLRPPLLLLLGALGPLPLHAAAVGTGEAGALIAGMSGAGKSTLAIACALEGMGLCGDDYVVLAESGERPVAHALNSTVRLSRASAGLLGVPVSPGAFGPDQLPPADPKAQFEIERIAPGALRPSLELRAVLVPRHDSEAAEPREMGGAAALRALAPSTVLQSPGRRPQAMSTLGALVRRLPCFELPVGGRPRQAAARARDLLESLA